MTDFCTYFELSEEKCRIFTSLQLNELLIPAYNLLFKDNLNPSVDAFNIFDKLKEKKNEINSAIEKALTLCTYFDKRFNTLEAQLENYKNYHQKHDFAVCLCVAYSKKMYELVQKRPHNKEKLEKALKEKLISGIYSTLPKMKTSERRNFKKKEEGYLPEYFFIGGLFFVIQLIWDCIELFLKIEKGQENTGWNFLDLLPIQNRLILQADHLLYLAKRNILTVKGGEKTSSNRNPERKEAVAIYASFKEKHPDLVAMFKENPKKNKPKTLLKNMLNKGKITGQMAERTLLEWAKKLLETDGILIKNEDS